MGEFGHSHPPVICHYSQKTLYICFRLTRRKPDCSFNGGGMWAPRELTPFLEISHWLTYGLYVAAILFCLAGIASLKK